MTSLNMSQCHRLEEGETIGLYWAQSYCKVRKYSNGIVEKYMKRSKVLNTVQAVL